MSDIQQLLTDHIDIWTAADTGPKSGRGRASNNAGSVYGVKKLRELILELAVCGKLVPKNESDEPASELLARIQAEKARLSAEGRNKTDKPVPPIADDERPFALPQGWEWAVLSEITTGMDSGWSPACLENSSPSDDVWGVLKTTAVQVMQYLVHENKELPKKLMPRPDAEVKAGDILFTRAGPTNRVAISCLVQATRPKLMISDKIIRFRPVDDGVDGRFLALCLNTGATASFLERAKSGMAASQVNISQEKLRLAPIPVPGITLQRRTVAKVDELMALCDQLETQHNNATGAHDKLVGHLLGTLTQSQDAEDFGVNWRRISAHFDTLFTTVASIDALKQTVLKLAVMGKLVKQDQNDEPAGELLKQIREKKAVLVAEGKLKKTKPIRSTDDGARPFALPEGWEWARFPELGEFGRGKSKHRPRNDPKLFDPGIYPLVQTGEVARADTIIGEYHSKYSAIGLSQSKMWPIGTLCITIAANIADSALLGFDACFPDSVVGFVPCEPLDDARYFLAFMKTAREDLLKFAPATAQKNINLEILESVLIPIPPLKEISRITAKIDELTALCDQLKSCITDASQLQQKLADVVEHATAGYPDSQNQAQTTRAGKAGDSPC